MDDLIFQTSVDISDPSLEVERTGLYYEVQGAQFASLEPVPLGERYFPPKEELYVVVEAAASGTELDGLATTKLFGLAQKREDSALRALGEAGYTVKGYFWGVGTSESVEFPLGAHALPSSLRAFREEYLKTRE